MSPVTRRRTPGLNDRKNRIVVRRRTRFEQLRHSKWRVRSLGAAIHRRSFSGATLWNYIPVRCVVARHSMHARLTSSPTGAARARLRRLRAPPVDSLLRPDRRSHVRAASAGNTGQSPSASSSPSSKHCKSVGRSSSGSPATPHRLAFAISTSASNSRRAEAISSHVARTSIVDTIRRSWVSPARVTRCCMPDAREPRRNLDVFVRHAALELVSKDEHRIEVGRGRRTRTRDVLH